MIISVDTEKEFEKKNPFRIKITRKKHTYTEYLSQCKNEQLQKAYIS